MRSVALAERRFGYHAIEHEEGTAYELRRKPRLPAPALWRHAGRPRGAAGRVAPDREQVGGWHELPRDGQAADVVRPVPREHGRPHARRREHRTRGRHRALRPPHEPLRRVHRRRSRLHPRRRWHGGTGGGDAAAGQPPNSGAFVVRGGGRGCADHGRSHPSRIQAPQPRHRAALRRAHAGTLQQPLPPHDSGGRGAYPAGRDLPCWAHAGRQRPHDVRLRGGGCAHGAVHGVARRSRGAAHLGRHAEVEVRACPSSPTSRAAAIWEPTCRRTPW